MKYIKILVGNATVITKHGNTSVKYRLPILQTESSARSLVDPDAVINGNESIEGWVRPFCGSLGEMLTLEMDDGKTATFFFRDTAGSARVNGISATKRLA